MRQWRYDTEEATIRSGDSSRKELVYTLYYGPDKVGYVYDPVMADKLIKTMNTVEDMRQAYATPGHR